MRLSFHALFFRYIACVQAFLKKFFPRQSYLPRTLIPSLLLFLFTVSPVHAFNIDAQSPIGAAILTYFINVEITANPFVIRSSGGLIVNNARLTNTGTINNLGTLKLDTGSSYDFTGGTLTNTGTMTFNRNFTFGETIAGTVNLNAAVPPQLLWPGKDRIYIETSILKGL